MEISSEPVSSQQPDAALSAYEPSRLECLGGVIVSPVGTFKHLASKPQWVFPLIVLVLWVLVGSVIRKFVISVTALTGVMSKASGAGGPLAAVGALGAGASVSFTMLVLEVGGVLVLLTAMAAVLYILSRAFKLKPRFYPLLSTLAYAEFMPKLVRISLKEFVPLLTGNFRLISRELPTGVLQIANAAEFPLFLRLPLARIELFHIWSFVLVAISVRFVAGASEKRAILISLLYWVVCIAAAFAAMAFWELISDALTGL